MKNGKGKCVVASATFEFCGIVKMANLVVLAKPKSSFVAAKPHVCLSHFLLICFFSSVYFIVR